MGFVATKMEFPNLSLPNKATIAREAMADGATHECPYVATQRYYDEEFLIQTNLMLVNTAARISNTNSLVFDSICFGLLKCSSPSSLTSYFHPNSPSNRRKQAQITQHK